jgi:hypothetical protein
MSTFCLISCRLYDKNKSYLAEVRNWNWWFCIVSYAILQLKLQIKNSLDIFRKEKINILPIICLIKEMSLYDSDCNIYLSSAIWLVVDCKRLYMTFILPSFAKIYINKSVFFFRFILLNFLVQRRNKNGPMVIYFRVINLFLFRWVVCLVNHRYWSIVLTVYIITCVYH